MIPTLVKGWHGIHLKWIITLKVKVWVLGRQPNESVYYVSRKTRVWIPSFKKQSTPELPELDS